MKMTDKAAIIQAQRCRRLERLVQKFGTFDEFMTQEELKRMREERIRQEGDQ